METTFRVRPASSSTRLLLLTSLVLTLLLNSLKFCSSLNHEADVLLQFKQTVELDHHASLANRIVGPGGGMQDGTPRSRPGVRCHVERPIYLTTRKLMMKNLMKAVVGPADFPQPSGNSSTIKRNPRNPRNDYVTDKYLAPAPSTPQVGNPPPLPNQNKNVLPDQNKTAPLPPHTSRESESRQRKHLVVYILVGSGVLMMLLVIAFILYHRFSKVVAVKPWATGLSGQLQRAFVTGVPMLRRQELQTACEDFSNIIGSFRYCTLYKGTLSSGVEIAVTSAIVKSTNEWTKQAQAQFRKKIEILSKVNHKNFVSLLGYCEESEPFTRMMVFEYAPNGTLSDHLHVKEAADLNWASRLRIAMGIAYCLEYMHQQNPPVILRNLESSSIYLTDDHAAKIWDLELWSDTTASDAGSGATGPLTDHIPNLANVVYKYGLILLEIISGRLPLSCEEHLLLQSWASDYLTGSKPLKDLIDPELKSYSEHDARRIIEVIKSCMNPDINERPSMMEIAAQLREITSVLPEGATPKLSPLWWAELEIITTEVN